jgi:hypothetical protein
MAGCVPSESDARASSPIAVPRQGGPLILIDGAVANLDTTMHSRRRLDSLAATVVDQRLVQLQFFPADDTAAWRLYGSRARRGVIVIRTRDP